MPILEPQEFALIEARLRRGERVSDVLSAFDLEYMAVKIDEKGILTLTNPSVWYVEDVDTTSMGQTEQFDVDECSTVYCAAREYVNACDLEPGSSLTVDVWHPSYVLVNEEVVEQRYGSREITIDVPLDHAKLISEAMGDDGHCGLDPDDHDFTGEGEGGCSENPGVWSLGGTKLSIREHCSDCGLRRHTLVYGSQRNHGEPEEAIEYFAPMCDDE